MIDNNLEPRVKLYVNELFTANAGHQLPFHHLERTYEILSLAKKVAQHYECNEQQLLLMQIAGWFSQTGFIRTGGDVGALKSLDIAHNWLTDAGVVQDDIDAVLNCIRAIHALVKPGNICEQILSDVATWYFGTEDFKPLNKLRKKEQELITGIDISKKEWARQTLKMLESHEYYTDYCQVILNAGKTENINTLLNKQEKQVEKILFKIEENNPAAVDETGAVIPDSKIIKEKSPVRGIEMMFRISSSNNVRISVMADNKAHIMITVNSIIISVIFGLIVRNMERHEELLIPSIILLLVNMLTIIYSLLATRPALSQGLFTQQQVDNKSVNMLFFGSFYKMPFDEYKSAMKKVMTDSEFMYACLVKDLYWQGKVLGRKYSLLRIAYTIFLYGIVISVIAFSIARIFYR